MNLFINRTERRLHLGWRIALQLLMHLLGVGLMSAAAAALVFAVLLATGQLAIGQGLSLPQLQAAINSLMSRQPLLLVLQQGVMVLLAVPLYVLIARLLDRRSVKDYGLRLNPVWWRDLGFGLLLGGVLMSILFGVELLLGWVQVTGRFATPQPGMFFWPVLLASLLHYVYVGISEELMSRGYQLRNIAESLNRGRLSPRTAVLISYAITSSIFGLLHMANPNASLFAGLNIILAGLMLGLGMVLTGSLAIPIGLHITWNFFQGNIFGLPVSGRASAISLLAVEQAGPDFWTGGLFGPEGGMLGVLVMLLGIGLTWAYIRLTRGRAGVHTPLAAYRPAGQTELAPAEAPQPGEVPTA
ncbi:MAG TPA: type II CAAX endopeptidase family protein [Anaerolineaceae bacterium]|nr:type II CAAX endopeptidase family protein [Anaerolineaceae bacterium]